jgi:hypothetical protein
MPSAIDFSTASGRRAWIRELLSPIDEAKWNGLARTLFAWQYERVPAFRRLCVARGVSPGNLRSWKDIPAMPQQVFKLEKIYAHGRSKPAAIYETSGTTTGQPGRQHLLSTDIYRAVSVEGARRAGLFEHRPKLHFLTPSPSEAPPSSLSAMFGFWKKNARFWVQDGQLDYARLREAVSSETRAGKAVALCGTAFSFVHLLDAWSGLPKIGLIQGSLLLETGGFKGRSREIAKPQLYARLSQLFKMPEDEIWNEYGMSELSSQAYARGSNGLHRTPPWARVLVVDPATGREVAVGKKGIARWIDLANTDSVMAVQTLDLAERAREGFRLIGRLPRTEPRGCSLGLDDMVRDQGNPRVPRANEQSTPTH